MKKLVKSTATLAILLATAIGMANDPNMSLTSGINSKSLVFEMDAQSLESKIKMTDNNARIIYSENILNKNYTKKFNLEKLEVGTYYFSIENDLSAVVYTLDVNRKEVKIEKKKENTTKPVFRQTGDRISINLFNDDRQKVTIEIVDNHDNIIFIESTKGELIIGKAFNFEKAKKGHYSITVKDGKKRYYHSIFVG
ncbi:hypothetical protein ACFQZJ_02670 [Maribacter chungangensis]|uniref:Por secretion system C-terminal sorting domain-containing protein n=1 Tax=Maribacter chungangensis TaxID=1069117 RepID=A0ABW3B148_9FLAO